MARLPLRPSALLVALAVSSVPAFAAQKLPRPLTDLSPAHFAEHTAIAEASPGGAVVLSTQAGYTRSRAIKGARANDVHLRAVVDRQSGKVSWQVWHDLVYVGGRKDLSAVHYTAGGVAQKAAPLHVEHWLDECPATDAPGFCNQFTRIAFELPEQTVREIASAGSAGSNAPWRLRFYDAAGKHVTGGIAPAEAAGLVQAFDAWRGQPG